MTRASLLALLILLAVVLWLRRDRDAELHAVRDSERHEEPHGEWTYGDLERLRREWAA